MVKIGLHSATRAEEEHLDSPTYCSDVIDVSPRWSEGQKSLIVEARYTLPDGDVYVAEYECRVKRKEGEYVYPEGEKWVSYRIEIPGKEWVGNYSEDEHPNNKMIEQMLYHLVLPETRRNVLKILRKRYKPLGYIVPQSRSFVIRIAGFTFYLDANGEYHLAT